MNEQLERILELPTRMKLGILLASLGVVVLVYWGLFYRPLGEEMSELDTEISGPKGLRVMIAQKEGIARNLDKYTEEVEKLDIELKKALAELPDKREIAQLLAKVSDKARDAGLEIRLFKPLPEQKKDFYAEVPVEVEVYGSYHQVATFFDEVGHLERIVNLDRINILEPIVEERDVTVKTGVVATSFRFLDESERPKAEEGQANDKRRRRRKAASNSSDKHDPAA